MKVQRWQRCRCSVGITAPPSRATICAAAQTLATTQVVWEAWATARGRASQACRRDPTRRYSSQLHGPVCGCALTPADLPSRLQGPYCSLCKVRDRSRYYSSGKSACIPCKGNLALTIGVAGGVVAAVLSLGALWRRFKHRTPPRLASLFVMMWRLYQQLSLRAKFKQASNITHHGLPHCCADQSVCPLSTVRCSPSTKSRRASPRCTTSSFPLRCNDTSTTYLSALLPFIAAPESSNLHVITGEGAT